MCISFILREAMAVTSVRPLFGFQIDWSWLKGNCTRTFSQYIHTEQCSEPGPHMYGGEISGLRHGGGGAALPPPSSASEEL